MHVGHSVKNLKKMRDMYQFTPLLKRLQSMCAVHALSVCDINSSLHRIGKRTVYNVITKTAKYLQGLFYYEDRDEFLVSARRFVLLLHGKKAKCLASLDDLRYHLATTTDSLQISRLLLKTHLINMSHKHSTKFKFGIKAIYQNLK